MDAEVSELVKGGELCVRIDFSRGKEGLLLTVKASPQIEQFMRELGDGSQRRVTDAGTQWVPADATKPLMYWSAGSSKMGKVSGERWNLSYIGNKLDLAPEFGTPYTVANLSFLRMCGISEGNGISFHIRNSVMSVPEMRNLKTAIGSAVRSLYVDFIMPIELSVFVTRVSTQETRG